MSGFRHGSCAPRSPAERALEDGDSTAWRGRAARNSSTRRPRRCGNSSSACGYPADLALTIEVAVRRGSPCHEDGAVSATLSPADLARRVRLQGLRIDRGTAEMFLAWWLITGVVEEVLPGQFRLTDEGHRVAGGLLAARDGEVA